MSFVDKNGQKTDDKLAEYWAHYTYDKNYDPNDKNSVNRFLVPNHAVCVVGYDDDFPKEYFNDPNGIIGGNGAFLVKNSWGVCRYNENGEIENTWGNAGTGYFWLSYYDQSLADPESFDFDTDIDSGTNFRNIDMYDYLAGNAKYSSKFDEDVYMANVFTADNNCTVRYIGIETAECDTDIEYSVYLLKDDAKNPVDGYCFATANEHFNYAGYHVADLGKTGYLPKGCKYSIVIKASNGGNSEIFVTREVNLEGYKYYGVADKTSNYAKSVVNPGESYVGTANGWVDWTKVLDKLHKLNKDLNNDGFEYDNFHIRSFPQTEIFTIGNEGNNIDKVFNAGDVISGVVLIENNTDFAFESMDLDVSFKIGESGKAYSLAIIQDMKLGEIKEMEYSYTVTEADVRAGKIECTAAILIDGEEFDYGPLYAELLGYSVRTGSESSAGNDGENPPTGVEPHSLMIPAVTAVVAVVLLPRTRKKARAARR